MRPTVHARDLPAPTVDRWAWLFVVVFFVGGDLVTTGLGLQVHGVVEQNPMLAPILAEHGLAAMVVLKGLVVGGGYVFYRSVPHPHGLGVPIGFAVVGVAVTGWNLFVVASALL
ncbi:MAG: hypothetical protein ACOCSN_00855 [Halanaeroarchaeum sp.]